MKRNDLLKFIENSTCSFTCVKEIEKHLINNEYVKLNENDNWKLNGNKFYVTKNDASIIAFEIPNNKKDQFLIITSHLDTPSLILKPSGSYINSNYLKYNIMPYGGLLNYSWLDRPLSLAGRIITKTKNKLESSIIDFKKPMLIVPSVAIHQNDKANSNLDLNMQVDMQPILSLANNNNAWKKIISNRVIDYDLYAYNIEKPYFIGNNKELLVSPRIDNITSVYSSLLAFLKAKSNSIKVFCSFNSEEIGSLTEDGADSNFLIDTLKKIAAYYDFDIVKSFSNSFIVSSDNTHAIHPNHNELSDDTGSAYLGKGFTIIKEINSTTNAVSSSIIKSICKKHKIKFQDATAKNDIATGSTLSNISLRHVDILSVDVGIAQLAMHSSYETCSYDDIISLYKMMLSFYETNITTNNNTYIIN